MKLSNLQISMIEQKINIAPNRIILRIDVSSDNKMSAKESSSNIYCVEKDFEIVWQVKEVETTQPFEDDMFVYLAMNSEGEIIADRFSGFVYKINPDTGEALQIGFHK